MVPIFMSMLPYDLYYKQIGGGVTSFPCGDPRVGGDRIADGRVRASFVRSFVPSRASFSTAHPPPLTPSTHPRALPWLHHRTCMCCLSKMHGLNACNLPQLPLPCQHHRPHPSPPLPPILLLLRGSNNKSWAASYHQLSGQQRSKQFLGSHNCGGK